MKEIKRVYSSIFRSTDALQFDFIFGATYIGFEEMKQNYVKKYGEVGANMQVVYSEIVPKKPEEFKLEERKKTLLKKL